MIITVVAAVAQNGVIGLKNSLPWKLGSDMKHFRELTRGHHVLMGRKTYESIGSPLPNRFNIVLTRSHTNIEGVQIAQSFDEAIELAEKSGTSELMVIGGSQVYSVALPRCEKMYLTRIQAHPAGDTYFPTINPNEWEVVSSQSYSQDEDNEYDFVIQTLLRKSKI